MNLNRARANIDASMFVLTIIQLKQWTEYNKKKTRWKNELLEYIYPLNCLLLKNHVHNETRCLLKTLIKINTRKSDQMKDMKFKIIFLSPLTFSS